MSLVYVLYKIKDYKLKSDLEKSLRAVQSFVNKSADKSAKPNPNNIKIFL